MPGPITIRILGDEKVGKSALFDRVNDGIFSGQKVLNDKARACELWLGEQQITVWDPSNPDGSCSAPYGWRPGILNGQFSSGFIICYDITNRESFEELQVKINNLKSRESSTIYPKPMILVGTKLDLAEQERVVAKQEAFALAKSHEIDFAEVSAANDYNVQEIFKELIRQIQNPSQYDILNFDKKRESIEICPVQETKAQVKNTELDQFKIEKVEQVIKDTDTYLANQEPKTKQGFWNHFVNTPADFKKRNDCWNSIKSTYLQEKHNFVTPPTGLLNHLLQSIGQFSNGLLTHEFADHLTDLYKALKANPAQNNFNRNIEDNYRPSRRRG